MVSHFRKAPEQQAVTSDLSLGGVFIQTELSFRRDEVVEFDLVPPGGQRLSITGIVRWNKLDQPRGVGIEFIKVTTPDKKKLQAYISSQTKRLPKP